MTYAFEQFTAVRMFSSPKYSPDGKTIAYIANTTGEFNLWSMPSEGGFASQLTCYSDKAVRTFAWSPDGTQLAFSADQHGDEMRQLFVMAATGGWPRQLTQNPDAQFDLADWTPDGQALIFSGNDQVPSEVHAQRYDLATNTVTSLSTGGLHYPGEVSPDGKTLLITEVFGNTDQNILIHKLESAEQTLATPHEDEAIFYPGPWRHDSSGFYLLSNAGRAFQGVGFYTLATASWEWVFTPDADVDGIALSKDGQRLVFSVNEAGSTKLYGKNLSTNETLRLPELPLGVASDLNINATGSKAVLRLATPRSSANIFELDLLTGDLQARDQSMLGGIQPEDLLEPESISYSSFDGRLIPAWLYKPKNIKGNCPVVLSIHGGPEAQERPDYAYTGLYQYLLSKGIGVLAPNIRGSTGYGIDYQRLIHRDWGGGELNDIEHAAKYLQTLDWVNPDKIAIFGGSFGGFATLSALTRLPAYWAAGVDIVGPSNLVTFLQSVPPHWKPQMNAWLGDPEKDAEFLMSRSPISYVADIRAPLLVIQGANDPRVVKSESDQMVDKMRAEGLAVEYHVDDKSGHGPTNREAWITWLRLSADFLEKHLLIN